MSLGPVMIDLQGTSIRPEELKRLKHPLVGGVILFTRNYQSPEQLAALVSEIHLVRQPQLLVAVDHEGGRVQRFRDGFTRLPPAAVIGAVYQRDKRRARHLAELCGWVMASELRAVGVDFSFAPVLDLDYGVSSVIGDRAWHRDPQVVADLCHSYMLGMHKAGMAATGKHFPGHGYVNADSHHELPIDDRRLEDIMAEDVLAFERMIHYGLAAVMPAHVIYSKVDKHTAGFSSYWLQDILRKRLGFQGVIFSDDLSMEAAGVAGGHLDRAKAALAAGCDMLLVCNNPEAAEQVLAGLGVSADPVSRSRLARMHGRHAISHSELLHSPQWKDAVHELAALGNAEQGWEM